jgi:hypothetical protein
MKNSSDTIRNRTRDLPVCSTVPQPTAPPRIPVYCSIATQMSSSISQANLKSCNTQIIISIATATRLTVCFHNPGQFTSQLYESGSFSGSQQSGKPPALSGNGRSTTIFTRARCWPLAWDREILRPSLPISLTAQYYHHTYGLVF